MYRTTRLKDKAYEMIAIVDYGIGNIASIANMINKVKAKSYLASTIEDIQKSEKIILPGIGHFKSGMDALIASGLIPAIEKKVFEEKTPILGICLGMQLFASHSEEGDTDGLGWIPGTVRHFSRKNNGQDIKIPHMGWNSVVEKKKGPLVKDFADPSKFYFVHSYYYDCDDSADILLETNYGGVFTSAVQKKNIMGAQFHPEKSHKYGMQLFKNFAEMGS